MSRQNWLVLSVIALIGALPASARAADKKSAVDTQYPMGTQSAPTDSQLPTDSQSAPDFTAISTPTIALSAAEATILADLNRTNLTEIKMGEMATDKGQSKSVQEYGDRVAQDHKRIQGLVEELAQRSGLKLQDEEQTLAGKEKQKMDKLQAKKGVEFDRSFAKEMAMAHDKAILRLQKAQAEIPTGSAVGDLVNQVLPVLKEHQQAAQQLTQQLAS